VTDIDCGHSHSGAICDGELFMWGLNPDCRLMIEGSEAVCSPSLTLMSELRREDPEAFETVQISLGVTHSGLITRSGEVFTAGSKSDGQLGSKFEDESLTNAELEQNADGFRSPLNQVLPFGDDMSVKALHISCGDAFSLVLDRKPFNFRTR